MTHSHSRELQQYHRKKITGVWRVLEEGKPCPVGGVYVVSYKLIPVEGWRGWMHKMALQLGKAVIICEGLVTNTIPLIKCLTGYALLSCLGIVLFIHVLGLVPSSSLNEGR